uniref:ATPase n=1 Tax=Chlorobium chlorochromatii (strain CaD3) TaxID=340177 RepID=Q3AUA3_CHLCH
MITKIQIKNFRQIRDQTLELKQVAVVIGPNNGGKTTLLQAISLFALGLRAWGMQRINKKSKAQKRTGVAITLEEVLNIPISDFKELWSDLNVREGIINEEGKPTSKNIRIEIHAEGYTQNVFWKIGFEFDFGRDSLIYVRLTQDENGELYDFPEVLLEEKIGYLPSVAGLKPIEDKLEIGSVLRNIGNGNTSDVLRNICYILYNASDKELWQNFVKQIDELFKIELNPPQYYSLTGLLKMSYNEGAKKHIDLSSLGSGAKQAILLFAYILAFPNTVNLLDEPDAHLEVIRQSNIYDRISDIAKKNNSQIIIASHSESVLNRAFTKDQVISGIFGEFEEVSNKKYITNALRTYGYEEFIIARQRPYIFYFEGTTDLDFIKAFCKRLGRSDVFRFIEDHVYPYPVANDVVRVRNHFDTLKKFIPTLRGFALFDNLHKNLESNQPDLLLRQWGRNEIENYIPIPQTLFAFIESADYGELWKNRFKELVESNVPPAAFIDMNHSFWKKTKMSDDFLTPLFEGFYAEAQMHKGLMDKSKFYQLVDYVDVALLQQEVIDLISAMYVHFCVK